MQGRTAATAIPSTRSLAARSSLPRRGGALALTAVIHLLALFLFLRPAAPLPEQPEPRTLSVFDLPVPPPPEPEPAPLPIARPVTEPPSGGSRGVARQRPAVPSRTPVPEPASTVVDVTPVVEAPPAPAPAPVETVGENSGGSGAQGAGTGSGSGDGAGTSSGRGGTDLSVLGRARWISTPTNLQFEREWPPGARGRTADVVLWCHVRRGGRAYGCSVAHETPPQMGFGDAAIRLTYLSRIRPVQLDGRDWYDLPVRITLHFRPKKRGQRAP